MGIIGGFVRSVANCIRVHRNPIRVEVELAHEERAPMLDLDSEPNGACPPAR